MHDEHRNTHTLGIWSDDAQGGDWMYESLLFRVTIEVRTILGGPIHPNECRRSSVKRRKTGLTQIRSCTVTGCVAG